MSDDNGPSTPRMATSTTVPDWRTRVASPGATRDDIREGVLSIDAFVSTIAGEQARSFRVHEARLTALEDGQTRLMLESADTRGTVNRIAEAVGAKPGASIPPFREKLDTLNTEVDGLKKRDETKHTAAIRSLGAALVFAGKAGFAAAAAGTLVVAVVRELIPMISKLLGG